MQWIVSERESGKKLVAFLKDKLGSAYSSRQIKNAIENNLCRVNQRFEHFASTILVKGDQVAFETHEMESTRKSTFEFSPADIIYENQDLLIYNKPAGYASDEEIAAALQTYGHDWELLHRLDRETTGLLMFTKGSSFREKMVNAFKSHEIEKVYLAIIDGIPNHASGIIDNYLGKKHEYQGQALWGSVPPHEGHHAVTAWHLQKKGLEASLLRCYPKTGRTHQIRVHMSEMNHPILGDKQYGKTIRCHYHAPRCLLHAYELSFIHPITLEKMHFQAPIPDDFKKALDHLMGGFS